jgi:predicted metal-dependent enzyme (double-stranded beta helix superfamily)
MEAPDLTEEQRAPCEGRACGHLLHTAADGSFFIISVVFPPGTSSGVHYHGAWGAIGILAGVD